MRIAVVTEGLTESDFAPQPWIHHRAELARDGIHIEVYPGGGEAFRQPFDAMLLHVWQDWDNPRRFHAQRILPLMQHYAVYRAHFPDTPQIVLNHVDMASPPFATAYWRAGDPVLYRTPPYDRRRAWPFPPETVWAFEHVWGSPCFASDEPPLHDAGFVGSPTGPRGYRAHVAGATARVGVGLCGERPLPRAEYAALMARCRIIVCPRGWGEQSLRHWDTWLSGKPMLTDRACAEVEMIPGAHLRAGEHFLVYDDPEEIPDLVRDWCRPSRADALAAIAANGRRAARGYDALARIRAFFTAVVQRTWPAPAPR